MFVAYEDYRGRKASKPLYTEFLLMCINKKVEHRHIFFDMLMKKRGVEFGNKEAGFGNSF